MLHIKSPPHWGFVQRSALLLALLAAITGCSGKGSPDLDRADLPKPQGVAVQAPSQRSLTLKVEPSNADVLVNGQALPAVQDREAYQVKVPAEQQLDVLIRRGKSQLFRLTGPSDSLSLDLRLPPSADDYTNESQRLLDAGDYMKASENASAALLLFPGAPQTLLLRSRAFLGLGAVNLAWRDLEQVWKHWNRVSPDDVEDIWAVATALAHSAEARRTDIALQAYQILIEMAPDNSLPVIERAELQTQQGDTAAALTTLDRGIKINPDSDELLRFRASMRLAEHEYLPAVADLQHAIKLTTHPDASLLLTLAEVYDALGKSRQSLQLYDAVLLDQPGSTTALVNRGLAAAQTGDFDHAIDDFTVAIQQAPQEPAAWNNRGVAHFGRGESETALSDVSRAIELSPRYAEALYNRGHILIKLGKADQAAVDLAAAAEIEPANPRFCLERARALIAVGRRDEAKKTLEQAAQLAPDDPQIPFLLQSITQTDLHTAETK